MTSVVKSERVRRADVVQVFFVRAVSLTRKSIKIIKIPRNQMKMLSSPNYGDATMMPTLQMFYRYSVTGELLVCDKNKLRGTTQTSRYHVLGFLVKYLAMPPSGSFSFLLFPVCRDADVVLLGLWELSAGIGACLS